VTLARYVHPDDVLTYLDNGWYAIGIDPRYRSQVMIAADGTPEPERSRVLTERREDDL